MVSTSRVRSAIYEWRARPEAVLLPALLQAITMGLNVLPIMYFLHIEDICRSAVVQKAYAADLAVYVTIVTVLGITLSGPYGAFSDMKGRKRTLLLASSLNVLGDTWLVLWASYAPFRRPWIVHIGGVFSGLGGGFSVLMSAHNAFIADTTRPTERSRYLGLSLVMLWVGSALGPLVSGPLTGRKLYATNLGLTSLIWAIYLLYVAFVLRETRVPTADRETSSVFATAPEDRAPKPVARLLVRTFLEPLRVLASSRTMLFPALGILGVFLAVGTFNFVVPYCDWKFGLSPREASVVSAVKSSTRALSVVLVLPAVLAVVDRLSKWRGHPRIATPQLAADDSEQLPLLTETSDDAEETVNTPERTPTQPSAESQPVEESSVARELAIVRIGLVLDAAGMLLLSVSRNSLEVIIATALGSLGAPAMPSMQALVTIGAPPEEMGRVLAGLSVLESLAVALRNPVFYPLFNATLEGMPGAIFGLAAAIFLLCEALMLCVGSRQYVR